ncbi:RNA polymerase sigma-70 factor (ECF subfamily) [Aquimarina sp. EL_43]|uniref:RNA polymerase sigma factor n=1 Tax=Aquimarina TaxID=290174 RepID=UPI00046EC48F|nr:MULTISPECIES: RNA polymerase sigma factor [Aquimarina]MBG6132435.1 RNA polymerase sigma-70 factor (ECF subfamily) [Aquimarina sp. EL_35]MBG6152566.1 RNA polymerase sigma-70 factor (ECF subfamily) [Aquimarina sp. EL_32]MBG6170507.1 RNA polymerase sigma-70 factor (ECF subfamily) [Aquimarina sp. EL_43]
MNHQSDQYYINQVLEGQVNAFSVLVERYQGLVYTVVYRMIKNKEQAEEVAQDSFIKAYKSLSNYRGDAKFSTWLYTIAYRKSLDAIKASKRMITSELIEEVSEGEMELVGDALNYLQTKERKKIISDSIMKLPEDEAAIVTLYYFEEKSVKEIVEIVNLTADNVKIKLYRSRKKLYSILKYHISPEISSKNGRAI